jgi:hypothetical protein
MAFSTARAAGFIIMVVEGKPWFCLINEFA